jgi:predicted alpha/beta-hydrolase family hydrolase
MPRPKEFNPDDAIEKATARPIKGYNSVNPAEVKTAAQLRAKIEEGILRLGTEHTKHCYSKEMLLPT